MTVYFLPNITLCFVNCLLKKFNILPPGLKDSVAQETIEVLHKYLSLFLPLKPTMLTLDNLK